MIKTHNKKTISYLRRLYGNSLRKFAFCGSSPADVVSWSAPARTALRKLIGLNRIRDELAGFEPSVSIKNLEYLDGYARQKGVLLAEPGLEVPFWYLKPKGAGPHPLGLFPHGHYMKDGLNYAAGVTVSPETQRYIKEEDRDVALQAAVRHGFAAIAPATRGFLPACVPDITGRHQESNCRSHLHHTLLAGRTVIGERVWDLQRLIDWAVRQPDISKSTILMMGNSGGGVATLYTAACDERINIAVASCSFCTFVGKNGTIHHVTL